MAQQVEINLRIPQGKEALKDGSGWPINNADVRFTKIITVEGIPKQGVLLPLTTGSEAFEGTVTRSEWNDEKEMFVVYCQYSKRSIPQHEYVTLMNDPAWTMKPLLA